MKKIIHDWATEIEMSPEEASEICRLGQGKKCCAFLVAGASGFECVRLSNLNSTIFERLEKGTMNAQGRGGWTGCGWEGEIENSQEES